MIQEILNLNFHDTFLLLLPYIATAVAVFLIVFIPLKIKIGKLKKEKTGVSSLLDNQKHHYEELEKYSNKCTIESADHINLLHKRAGELNSTIYNLEKQVQKGLDAITEQDRFLKEFGDKLITSDLKITELTKKLNLCSQTKKSKKSKSKVKRAKQ